MTDTARDATAASAVELMTHYSFDHAEVPIRQLVDQWLQVYPAQWIRLALIEALYQGRYKAISVEQILALWQRRGQPIYRFNHEFERLVCNRFPRKLSAPSPQSKSASPTQRNRSRSRSKQAQPFFVPLHPPQEEQSCHSQLPDGSTALPSSSRLEVPPASNLKSVSQPSLEPEPERQVSLSVAKIAEPSLPEAIAPKASQPEEVQRPQENPGLGKDSIHRFVPISEPSGFCTKLTAIALSERARKLPMDKLNS